MNHKRLANERRSQALDMQQSALMQLMLSALLLFVLALVAAYVIVQPRLIRTPHAVAPVLDAFMRAGASQDSLSGHTMLSESGLRTFRQEDVAALYDQRTYFDGYERLRVTSFRMLSAAPAEAPESADVAAVAFYRSSDAATLSARMELEQGEWHIASIKIQREGQEPR